MRPCVALALTVAVTLPRVARAYEPAYGGSACYGHARSAVPSAPGTETAVLVSGPLVVADFPLISLSPRGAT
jgi:hypothetical protein